LTLVDKMTAAGDTIAALPHTGASLFVPLVFPFGIVRYFLIVEFQPDLAHGFKKDPITLEAEISRLDQRHTPLTSHDNCLLSDKIKT
jgi:hypothetical protein